MVSGIKAGKAGANATHMEQQQEQDGRETTNSVVGHVEALVDGLDCYKILEMGANVAPMSGAAQVALATLFHGLGEEALSYKEFEDMFKPVDGADSPVVAYLREVDPKLKTVSYKNTDRYITALITVAGNNNPVASESLRRLKECHDDGLWSYGAQGVAAIGGGVASTQALMAAGLLTPGAPLISAAKAAELGIGFAAGYVASEKTARLWENHISPKAFTNIPAVVALAGQHERLYGGFDQNTVQLYLLASRMPEAQQTEYLEARMREMGLKSKSVEDLIQFNMQCIEMFRANHGKPPHQRDPGYDAMLTEYGKMCHLINDPVTDDMLRNNVGDLRDAEAGDTGTLGKRYHDAIKRGDIKMTELIIGNMKKVINKVNEGLGKEPQHEEGEAMNAAVSSEMRNMAKHGVTYQGDASQAKPASMRKPRKRDEEESLLPF